MVPEDFEHGTPGAGERGQVVEYPFGRGEFAVSVGTAISGRITFGAFAARKALAASVLKMKTGSLVTTTLPHPQS